MSSTHDWITTSELLRRVDMSRTQLNRLRQDQVLHAGDHFILKGTGPRAGFLWHFDSVINTLAGLAEQNREDFELQNNELRC